jgi:hypothetical protein
LNGSWRATSETKAIRTDQDATAAVVQHLTGQATFAFAPIANAVVIDVDLPDYRDKNVEAPRELKLQAAADVSLVLDSLGIPHLHIDSRGGIHTWIRLHREPPKELFEALATLLARRLLWPAGLGRRSERPPSVARVAHPDDRASIGVADCSSEGG